ncbi:MAG: UDP-N-acetylmuramoyl-L-alanine--D-glutamate ligase [Candidatus Eisenbacteria bacterium]|nr:UDP-N-acetylmuramoyl-L-alanine--D-glutamate ligase [Candidatus Eisenbacteria bacterium]
MNKPFFAGKNVLVVGLQRSGIGVSKLLLRYGCSVIGTDLKKRDELDPELSSLERSGAAIICGRPDFHIPRDIEFIVASPGVPLYSPILMEAEKAGKEILGELEIAFSVLRCPAVCVTGTNGKSTCVSLVGEIFSRAKRKTVVAGNVGLAFSGIADSLEPDGIAVIEVSSFQLETMKFMKPRVGVLLNVTPDHLDRHKSFEEYLRLKMRLFENQTQEDFAVINRDDETQRTPSRSLRSRVLYFGMNKAGEEGAFVEAGNLKVNFDGETKTVIPVDKIAIRGPHNLSNAMAAVCAAAAMGVSLDSIESALAGFEGLPHRLQNVGSLEGVSFVNDSKATNIDAMKQALLSFKTPLVLIAGGRDKDGNFAEVSGLVEKNVRHVVLMGEASQKIRSSWPGVRSTQANSMNEAVEVAFELAQKGDVVILSPGCASYDMFKNFEDRGAKFAQAFLSLKEKIMAEKKE